jgi:hypothetical protein
MAISSRLIGFGSAKKAAHVGDEGISDLGRQEWPEYRAHGLRSPASIRRDVGAIASWLVLQH